MQFTGERFVPTEQGRIRLEHYHRYATVLHVVAGKDILDLACGEGYGSYYMAGAARSVVGVDISDEAVEHATEHYKKLNLSFRQGSAIKLDLPDASFDMVVSFETIEHLAEQSEMVAEIRRVLRRDGFLIISSPNRPIYSEESGEHNEFHVKELDFSEFDYLLKTQFPSVQYYGQRMLMGSVVQPLGGGQSAFEAWHDDGSNLIPQSGSLRDPVYFIAVAGAAESFLPNLNPSIIYPDDLDLVKHYVGFAKWAQNLSVDVAEKDKYIAAMNREIEIREEHIANLSQTLNERNVEIADFNQTVTERDVQIASLNLTIAERDTRVLNLDQTIAKQDKIVAEREAQIADLYRNSVERDARIASLDQTVAARNMQVAELNQMIVERDAQITELNDETVHRGEWALGLEAELMKERERLREVQENLNALVGSHSWRMTLPLRETKLWLSKPGKQSRRYAKKSLGLVKRLYQALPLDTQKVENHRNFIAEKFPNLLLATGTRLNGKELRPTLVGNIEEVNTPKLPQKQDFAESIFSAQDIRIDTSENPFVSVIIPVYGEIGYTLNCLVSIAANPPQVPFEIIVVDDHSPDESAEILENVKGIRLLKSEQNQGFIRSTNIGANSAKGKYLYFLNNDAQVTTGWLDELARTFHEFPGTGLVGSKLIYPDGRLQEAGGIIWQNGSAWNFGRFQDPLLPVYNYAREVDYCSGASIMIPKKLFDELGGFDEHYLPAYCEDSDLALKIREKGFRVIYQPLSTVIHYEGVSSGTDLSEGIKSYQVENTKKLYSRWKKRLREYQSPGVDSDSAKDRRAKHRVLVLEHCTPTPNQDAGSVTVFNFLLLLREMDFQVTFIPEDNFLYMPEYTTNLQRIGIEVLYAPYVMSVEQHLKEYGERYDLAFLFRPSVVARNIETIHQYCPKAKVLFYTHDLHFLRMTREAELFQDAKKAEEAEEMKSLELAVMNAVDASILVSEKEFEAVRNELPKNKVHIVPLILNTTGTDKEFADRKDIIFVGGFQHTPNIDAVKYFVSEIMPLVRKDLPGVCFYAVGSKAPDEIKALASDDVIITGFVEDLTSLLDKMRVSVAPLRYGAGVKGKVGTAMAAGLPVVATTLAAEGMSLTDEKNIFVADDPEDFAKAIVKIYQDEGLWNNVSQNSIKFADNAWGAESSWKILSGIISSLGVSTIRGNHPISLYSEYKHFGSKANKSQNKLTPIASVKNRNQFECALKDKTLNSVREFEKKILESKNAEAFEVEGFCVPCNKEVSFLIDMNSGGTLQQNVWLPNWRERLECPFCRMNNRQRLVATVVKQSLNAYQKKNIYLMEQITPIFRWVTQTFIEHHIIGSEYLGFEYDRGTVVNGIRHENVEDLSFSDGVLDLIISNDVFEHVPNPFKAFAECARALKKGGTMLVTIPFFDNEDTSVSRAKISQGNLHHLLEPVYHGNPVNDGGSLVFTDFGWNVLDEMQAAGFKNVSIEIYASSEFGHLGNGQMVFRLVK